MIVHYSTLGLALINTLRACNAETWYWCVTNMDRNLLTQVFNNSITPVIVNFSTKGYANGLVI